MIVASNAEAYWLAVVSILTVSVKREVCRIIHEVERHSPQKIEESKSQFPFKSLNNDII